MSKNTMSVTRNGKVEQREIDHIPELGYTWARSGEPFSICELPYPVHGPGEIVVQTVGGETIIVDGVPQ